MRPRRTEITSLAGIQPLPRHWKFTQLPVVVANIPDRTIFANRLPGLATVATVQDEYMVHVAPVAGWQKPLQLILYFFRCSGIQYESNSVGNTKYVCIDGERVYSECDPGNHLRCFVADSSKAFKSVYRVGYNTVKIVYDLPRHFRQVPGFIIRVRNRPDKRENIVR